jgi:aminoglycoside 3-N-acetyltransferase
MNFKNSLFKLFKTIKVNHSSFVCIHLDAKIFNDHNIEKKKIKENLKILLSYFNKKGTIVIPTFSYSFTDKKNYDIIKSKSNVGFLTNEILKLKGVKRTLHPIFRFAISGKKEKDLLMCDTKNCFGKNTVFDYLIKKRATIISNLKKLGVPGLIEGYVNIHQLPTYKKKIANGTRHFPWKLNKNDKNYKMKYFVWHYISNNSFGYLEKSFYKYIVYRINTFRRILCLAHVDSDVIHLFM